MNNEMIQKVASLAQRGSYIFLATSGEHCEPHVVSAGNIEYVRGEIVAVTQFLCQITAANIGSNKHVSIVVWNPDQNVGFQLVGEVESLVERAMIDGYTSLEKVNEGSIPQIEWRLLVEVKSVLDFSRIVHRDAVLA